MNRELRRAKVYRNNQMAGILLETDDRKFVFTYDQDYLNSDQAKAISLTMPLSTKEYTSEHLFPFFYSLLSEGVNKRLQSRRYKVDEKDAFGLLLATAGQDTIGAVTVKSIDE